MQAFTSINSPETGETLDRGIALRFPGPASFTGDFISCLWQDVISQQYDDGLSFQPLQMQPPHTCQSDCQDQCEGLASPALTDAMLPVSFGILKNL